VAKAGIRVVGVERLMAKWKEVERLMTSRIMDMRVQVARELTEALMKNIPVWSGRTIASIVWAAGPAQSIQPHPQRGGFAIEGAWHSDSQFGKTSQMSMGAEPMRGQAETLARAQAEGLHGYFGKQAVLTVNSVPWSLIERGEAPGGKGQKARNVGIVSAIALAQVRSKFAGVLK